MDDDARLDNRQPDPTRLRSTLIRQAAALPDPDRANLTKTEREAIQLAKRLAAALSKG